MKLLIVTQAVDLDDPVLGFMHRWIEAFATRFDSIEVICLKKGRSHLPENVHVHSLGKEHGTSRVKYIFNFYRYLWALRGSYDAVFVHMNQEYVLLGGIFWRMSGKKVILWRNHKKGTWTTRLAGMIAHTVCYTSAAAYVAHFKNAVQMPIGIDTDIFVPPASPPPANSILFLGRIDAVKKPIEFLDALKILVDQNVDFHADIYGDPTYPDDPYFVQFKDAARSLLASGRVMLHPSVPNEQTPKVYGAHQIYVNLTPSGSFDKTIGEAMACGCIVVVANDAVQKYISEEQLIDPVSAASLGTGIRLALNLSEGERKSRKHRSREYVMREHSLSLLVEKLAYALGTKTL